MAFFFFHWKEKIKHSSFYNRLKNPYLILILFLWILFLDTNNLISILKLYKTNQELEKSIEYYSEELRKIDSTIRKLNDDDELEKIAREKYYMKKKDEDIFIVPE